MSADTARTEHELRLMAAMVDCTHELTMGLGRAANAEADEARKLQLFDAFLRGSQAVRLGIRLSLALRAAPRAARAEAGLDNENERAEVDPSEIERAERDPGDGAGREREEDRDREVASVPKFLATLRRVAAEASDERLPADLRAGAATLTDLLARTGEGPPPVSPGPPAGGLALLVRPSPSKPAARSALLGSASAPQIFPAARPPPRRSG